ncbi:hypothetical protein T492DRAFT_939472 [Pavlovales sp. CCMP2436]|nr:hypothetical protein T492DRAFT_939472 [Pavlovales sp. CCMP2436]
MGLYLATTTICCVIGCLLIVFCLPPELVPAKYEIHICRRSSSTPPTMYSSIRTSTGCGSRPTPRSRSRYKVLIFLIRWG